MQKSSFQSTQTLSRGWVLIFICLLVTVSPNAQTQGSAPEEDTFQIPVSAPEGFAGVRQMTLSEVLEMGLAQNPKLRIASEKVEQARATYEQRKSDKNPQLLLSNRTSLQPRRSIDTSNLLENRMPSFPDSFTLVDPLTDQFSLSLQKLLTTFGKVESVISAAFIQIDVESANALVERQEVILDVKEAFFLKLKADGTVEATRNSLAVSEEILGDTRALLEQGVAARYDLLQAQIEVTRSVESLSQNFTKVDQASANLANVLAEREFRVQPIAPEPARVDEAVNLTQLQDFALRSRPELLSLNYRVDVAEQLLLAAKADNKPSLVLAANYQTAFGQSLTPKNVPSITLQLQWALYDGGLKKAKVKEAESILRELSAAREVLDNNVRLEVEKNWLDLLQSSVSLITAEQQLANAVEYYDMARQRFLSGISPSIEVSNALNNLVISRSRLVEIRFDRDLAFAKLEKALGQSVPERNLTTDFLNVEARRTNDEN